MIASFAVDTPSVADAHYHHTRAWANILIGSFFFMAVGLGAAFFMGLQYAAEAGWATSVKRITEAVSWFLPWGLSLMMLMFILGHFGVHNLYAFFDKDVIEHDVKVQEKMGYFGAFWWARTILYMAGWLYFTHKLRQNSVDADHVSDNSHHWKNVKLGAWFMVLFAVTSSTASWDWVMSLDIHWFSTLFGWYVFSGMWVSAIICITLIVVYLRKLGYLDFVTESTIHDLGKWMFAISFLWTYLYFAQFLLYWYADIPEEVIYFQQRWENYKALMWTMFFINFTFPMIMLMSRDSKRNFWFLTFVGFVILAGHYLDVIVMVMPATVGTHWTGLSWMEIGPFLGFLGLFIFVVFTNLTKRPLAVKNHPFMDEALHHSV
ncbi:MAG: quinol:cytochrome C oxidoreductase [Bacteroidetes bacterium]|nr:quinol:cytochrome C oxidoreductase [Bacteroidota bacterium]